MALVTPVKLRKSGSVPVGFQELEPGDQIAASSILGYAGRNLFVNGALGVWQQSDGYTTTTPGYGAVDCIRNNASGITVGMNRIALPVGSLPGCLWSPSFAMRMTVGTEASSAALYSTLQIRFENLRRFSGKRLAISYWARASVAGLKVSNEFSLDPGAGGSLGPIANNGYNPVKHTLTTSYVHYTSYVDVPDLSAATLGPDETSFLTLNVWMSAGSSHDARNVALGFQTGLFDFAGFQLELGGEATALEQVDPAIELVRCQRYYEKSYNLKDFPGTITRDCCVRAGLVSAFYLAVGSVAYKVQKRAAPAITTYASRNGAVGNLSEINSTGTYVTNRSCNPSSIGDSSFNVGGDAYTPGNIGEFHWVADARL